MALKLWNGNVQTMVPTDEARKRGLRHNSYTHAYACAPTRAAVCRMLAEWSRSSWRGLDAYVRDYWHCGAWGNAMEGVEPTEQGLWVQYDYGARPERVWPTASTQQP